MSIERKIVLVRVEIVLVRVEIALVRVKMAEVLTGKYFDSENRIQSVILEGELYVVVREQTGACTPPLVSMIILTLYDREPFRPRWVITAIILMESHTQKLLNHMITLLNQPLALKVSWVTINDYHFTRPLPHRTFDISFTNSRPLSCRILATPT